jgi:hypothetical protein
MRARYWLFLLSSPLAALAFQSSALQRAADEYKIATRELGLRTDSPRVTAGAKPFWTSWHGRVFHNLRNDLLDAVPHEVVQRGGSRNILRRNQFGFNAGGPLVIPRLYNGAARTFVNISYEGVRERIGRSFLRTVAIAPERSGDFSQTVDPAGQPLPIYDPLATQLNPGFEPDLPVSTANLQYTRAPFPGNRIPAARLDPVALKAVAFYPLPNASAGPFFRNNYFVFSPETNQADGMIFKVDHTPREKHRLTFNTSFTNGLAVAPRFFDTIADSGNNDRRFKARRASLEWTATRNATTLNTFTIDIITDKSTTNRPNQEGGRSAIGLAGPLRDIFPDFRFGNYLGMGRSNPDGVSGHNYFYFTDGFSTLYKGHRLRATAQFRRYQVNAYLPAYPAGFFQFGPSLTSLPGIVNTGSSFASFLLGYAESGNATIVEHPSYWRGNYIRFALSDTYEYSKNLTFTASLALATGMPRTEKYDRFSTVDLNTRTLVFANRDGRGRALQPTIWRPDLSLGVAWNPRGNPKSVVRCSYGLSFGTIPIYTTQWASQGFVANPAYISSNIQLAPAVSLSAGVPPLSQPLPDLRPDAANFTNADLVDLSGRLPIYQSANLSFERELPRQILLSLNLGHARGQRLFVSSNAANPNAIPLTYLDERDRLNSEAYRRSIRPYPQFQRFNLFSSWPSGNYKRHAAVLRLEKRSSTGLTVNTTYELSKQLDDYSGPYGVQDFYNFQNEWSLSSSNNPHRLSLSFSYELPFGAKKPLLAYQDWRRFLVDGWSISGITSVQSGEPLAFRPQFNNTGGVIDALRVNLVPGVEPTVAEQSLNRWFNPEAFAQPPDFAPGNGPRTHPYLLGPASQNHDLSVSKRFAVTSERVVELVATGFNWTNTGNPADPDTVIGPSTAPNANAGRVNETRGGRVIQVGLRLSF